MSQAQTYRSGPLGPADPFPGEYPSNTWEPVREALPAQARAASSWEHRELVQKALREDRVTLALQPIVRADKPAQIAFYEGLMRIISEEGEELSPARFLPFVQGMPEAIELDRAVLRRALLLLAENPGLRLSINICPETMGDQGWLETLRRMASLRPDLAYRLIVEITEHGDLEQNPATRGFLAELAAQGCAVALDDFGSGATALRYFTTFNFDIVKLDGRFCQGLAEDRDLQCIVQAITQIADHFDLVVVAEYIARQEDALMAQSLGVDCLQGALFGLAAIPDPAPDLSDTCPILGLENQG